MISWNGSPLHHQRSTTTDNGGATSSSLGISPRLQAKHEATVVGKLSGIRLSQSNSVDAGVFKKFNE